METACAYAPANISLIFKSHANKDPRWTGSTGVGFTIDKGIAVEISCSSSNKIFFNGKVIDFPTVLYVIQTLTNQTVTVRISSELPLGYGFGLSGASALATAYAINKLLSLNKSEKDLAIIAHTADVIHRTGLGDVTNQYLGGFLVKFVPSSHFEGEKIELTNTPVYIKYFSKLETPSVLNNAETIEKVNTAADSAMEQMKRLIQKDNNITMSTILAISKQFVTESDLLNDKQTIQLIDSIEKAGGHATMMILGNAVVADTNFEGAMEFTISDKRVCLL